MDGKYNHLNETLLYIVPYNKACFHVYSMYLYWGCHVSVSSTSDNKVVTSGPLSKGFAFASVLSA